MKFDQLVDILSESPRYELNDNGKSLLNKYLSFINELNKWMEKDAVLAVLSNIEATNRAKPEFKLAKKLSILTNDGRQEIDGNMYMINIDDELMQYLIRK